MIMNSCFHDLSAANMCKSITIFAIFIHLSNSRPISINTKPKLKDPFSISQKINSTEFNAIFDRPFEIPKVMEIFKSVSNSRPIQNRNDFNPDQINASFMSDYLSIVKEFVRSSVLEELNKDYFKNAETNGDYHGIPKRDILKSLQEEDGPFLDLSSYTGFGNSKTENTEHTGYYGGMQMFTKGPEYNSGVYKRNNNEVTPGIIYKNSEETYRNHYTSPDNGLKKYGKIQKSLFFHVAPPDSSEEDEQTEPPLPEKQYNIIFIKAPDHKQKPPKLPKQKDEQTLVYVLVKKPEDVTLKTPIEPTLPTKPEVFYIRYQTRKTDEQSDDLEYGSANNKEVVAKVPDVNVSTTQISQVVEASSLKS